MEKVKKIFSTILSMSFAATIPFWEGLNQTGKSIGYNVNSDTSLPEKIGKIVSISSIFLGVIFLGLMIYAGYTWMIARGNEQEVTRAKNIIIYAVIGLVVVLSAYVITNLAIPLWGIPTAVGQ